MSSSFKDILQSKRFRPVKNIEEVKQHMDLISKLNPNGHPLNTSIYSAVVRGFSKGRIGVGYVDDLNFIELLLDAMYSIPTVISDISGGRIFKKIAAEATFNELAVGCFAVYDPSSKGILVFLNRALAINQVPGGWTQSFCAYVMMHEMTHAFADAQPEQYRTLFSDIVRPVYIEVTRSVFQNIQRGLANNKRQSTDYPMPSEDQIVKVGLAIDQNTINGSRIISTVGRVDIDGIVPGSKVLFKKYWGNTKLMYDILVDAYKKTIPETAPILSVTYPYQELYCNSEVACIAAYAAYKNPEYQKRWENMLSLMY